MSEGISIAPGPSADNPLPHSSLPIEGQGDVVGAPLAICITGDVDGTSGWTYRDSIRNAAISKPDEVAEPKLLATGHRVRDRVVGVRESSVSAEPSHVHDGALGAYIQPGGLIDVSRQTMYWLSHVWTPERASYAIVT
jgi:hypothetical protein